MNLPAFVARVPQVAEVSIGHALIADALEFGMGETVRRYLAAIAGRGVSSGGHVRIHTPGGRKREDAKTARGRNCGRVRTRCSELEFL